MPPGRARTRQYRLICAIPEAWPTYWPGGGAGRRHLYFWTHPFSLTRRPFAELRRPLIVRRGNNQAIADIPQNIVPISGMLWRVCKLSRQHQVATAGGLNERFVSNLHLAPALTARCKSRAMKSARDLYRIDASGPVIRSPRASSSRATPHAAPIARNERKVIISSVRYRTIYNKMIGALRPHYPGRADGTTLLTFRRLFLIAVAP